MNTLWLCLILASALVAAPPPPPPGKLVDLGGRRLHLNCKGSGSPTVVVEYGLGDFSSDWILVHERVAKFTRICVYDRAGYAWSDAGPKPRTFAQINFELREGLAKAGERGPYVFVGHSYGGPVVRAFAERYPSDTAGIVFIDAVSEKQRISISGKALLLGQFAEDKPIPEPKQRMTPEDAPAQAPAHPPEAIRPPYDRLPAHEQNLHLWAANQSALEDTENSQRQWSSEYFAAWAKQPQQGRLGSIPLLVLTRESGGYGNDLDMPPAELERIRRESQADLAALSTHGKLRFIASGHNMHLEAPDEVAAAIRDVVQQVRAVQK